MSLLTGDMKASLVAGLVSGLVKDPVDTALSEHIQNSVKTAVLSFENERENFLDMLRAKHAKAKEAGDVNAQDSLARRIKKIEEL